MKKYLKIGGLVQINEDDKLKNDSKDFMPKIRGASQGRSGDNQRKSFFL